MKSVTFYRKRGENDNVKGEYENRLVSTLLK